MSQLSIALGSLALRGCLLRLTVTYISSIFLTLELVVHGGGMEEKQIIPDEPIELDSFKLLGMRQVIKVSKADFKPDHLSRLLSKVGTPEGPILPD